MEILKMSIDTKEFDKHKNPFKYIIEFLKNNRERAFTAEYIAKEIGIDEREVKSALTWNLLAAVLDATYRNPVETASVGGVTYYKYSGW